MTDVYGCPHCGHENEFPSVCQDCGTTLKHETEFDNDQAFFADARKNCIGWRDD